MVLDKEKYKVYQRLYRRKYNAPLREQNKQARLNRQKEKAKEDAENQLIESYLGVAKSENVKLRKHSGGFVITIFEIFNNEIGL